MLKDRRILLEQEITKQKQTCGQLYKQIIVGNYNADPIHRNVYEKMRTTLSDNITELAIIDQMIADGHE